MTRNRSCRLTRLATNGWAKCCWNSLGPVRSRTTLTKEKNPRPHQRILPTTSLFRTDRSFLTVCAGGSTSTFAPAKPTIPVPPLGIQPKSSNTNVPTRTPPTKSTAWRITLCLTTNDLDVFFWVWFFCPPFESSFRISFFLWFKIFNASPPRKNTQKIMSTLPRVWLTNIFWICLLLFRKIQCILSTRILFKILSARRVPTF